MSSAAAIDAIPKQLRRDPLGVLVTVVDVWRLAVRHNAAPAHQMPHETRQRQRLSQPLRRFTKMHDDNNGMYQIDPGVDPAKARAPGSANPDSNFRYDATLNGYIYNLSTSGLSSGTWQLNFKVAGDPIPHAETFDVR